jgi:hypothetical protein
LFLGRMADPGAATAAATAEIPEPATAALSLCAIAALTYGHTRRR